MKDENVIWTVLAIILGYIFLTDGTSLSQTIKYIILNNLFLILVGALVAAWFIMEKK